MKAIVLALALVACGGESAPPKAVPPKAAPPRDPNVLLDTTPVRVTRVVDGDVTCYVAVPFGEGVDIECMRKVSP